MTSGADTTPTALLRTEHDQILRALKGLDGLLNRFEGGGDLEIPLLETFFASR